MIKVLVSKEKIEIIGHSDYDDFGKDIVCSAVSSIMITSINAIYKFSSDSIKYTRIKKANDLEDCSIIEIIKNDEITNKLLDNMIEMFKSLAKDYPKNIKVKER